MTPAEHYRQAEDLLFQAEEFAQDASEAQLMVARAQVHATLAGIPRQEKQ